RFYARSSGGPAGGYGTRPAEIRRPAATRNVLGAELRVADANAVRNLRDDAAIPMRAHERRHLRLRQMNQDRVHRQAGQVPAGLERDLTALVRAGDRAAVDIDCPG